MNGHEVWTGSSLWLHSLSVTVFIKTHRKCCSFHTELHLEAEDSYNIQQLRAAWMETTKQKYRGFFREHTSTFGWFGELFLRWRVLGDFGRTGSPRPVVRVQSLRTERELM